MAILSILKTRGEVSAELNSSIMAIKDFDTLEELLKCAVRAQSVSEFIDMANL